MDSETSNTDSSRVEAGEGGGLGDFVDVDKKEVLADIGREEIKGVEDGTEVHPEQHSVTLNPIVTETRDAEIHSLDAEADNRATEDDHFSSTHHYPKNDNIRDITEPSVSAESSNIPAFIEKDSTPNVDGSPEIPRVRETAVPSNPDDSNGIDGSKGGFDETPKQLPEELRKGVMVLQCESTAPGGICNVYLVGTAHVSQESCREVQAVIRYLKPQVVFLELCSSRLPMLAPQNLQVPTVSEMVDMWKNRHMNAFGILYSWFLAKVAEKLEVFPGSEFRTAFEEAMAYGAKVTLGDRPVQITLRRTWAKMSLWHKTRFLFCMVFQAIFLPSPEELNKMMREMDDVDMLTLVIQEMSKTFPSLMETLLHERDLRPCSDSKKREMSGSGIFTTDNPTEGSDSTNGASNPDRSSVRLYQQAAGIVSQISFGVDGSVSPKKPTSLTEVAKQKELSGSQESTADIHIRKQCSQAKSKELSGNDIFGPPPELPPRSLNRNLEPKEEPKEIRESAEPAPRNVRTSVKVSNPAGGHSQIIFGQDTTGKTLRRIHDQKVAELTGNNIFKGDTPVNSAEKPVSVAKLREMSGSDIFADEKPVGRDCLGGIRKPPGGESSIALV